jgi:t-SNARE complex subunit (syntaxin)
MEFEEFKYYMDDVKNTIHNVSEKVDTVKDELGEIKTQTILTNGRVNSLEAISSARNIRMWKWLFIIVSGLIAVTAPILSYVIIHHWKN